jgi:hypothetical protein
LCFQQIAKQLVLGGLRRRGTLDAQIGNDSGYSAALLDMLL